jgi:hypothetical protein
MYFTDFAVADKRYNQDFLRGMFPFMNDSQTAELHRLYGPEKHSFHLHNVSQTITDAIFHCTARTLARTYTSHGLPVTRALFSHALGVLRFPFKRHIPVRHADGIITLTQTWYSGGDS